MAIEELGYLYKGLQYGLERELSFQSAAQEPSGIYASRLSELPTSMETSEGEQPSLLVAVMAVNIPRGSSPAVRLGQAQ